ncbi:MAG TPA: DNA gyrase inhibitor YacG [Burkholderiaceae bacterium]
MTHESKGARVVRCPGCGGPSVYAAENVYRPFCSARCKNNDFGAWASEGYSVPADPDLPPSDIDLDTDHDRTLPH